MSAKAEKILQRYLLGYVTPAQLKRYLDLSAITQEEYDTIRTSK